MIKAGIMVRTEEDRRGQKRTEDKQTSAVPKLKN